MTTGTGNEYLTAQTQKLQERANKLRSNQYLSMRQNLGKPLFFRILYQFRTFYQNTFQI